MQLKLSSPVVIGPNLRPAVFIGGCHVSVWLHNKTDKHGRTAVAWQVLGSWCGDDLDVSGTDLFVHFKETSAATLQAALETLLSFLSAFAEAQRYPNSDNKDLFPEELAGWAALYSDELAVTESDLEEYCCIEEA